MLAEWGVRAQARDLPDDQSAVAVKENYFQKFQTPKTGR